MHPNGVLPESALLRPDYACYYPLHSDGDCVCFEMKFNISLGATPSVSAKMQILIKARLR